jgi:hemerythrin-like domain-containing protein
VPVIEDLGAEHDRLLTQSNAVRAALDAGDSAGARARLDGLLELLRRHNDVEEASVFAALSASGELVDQVDALRDEHGAVWAEVTAGLRQDADVLRLLDDLRDHIAREEYDLFPATLLAVAPAEWEAIEQAAAEVRARAA